MTVPCFLVRNYVPSCSRTHSLTTGPGELTISQPTLYTSWIHAINLIYSRYSFLMDFYIFCASFKLTGQPKNIKKPTSYLIAREKSISRLLLFHRDPAQLEGSWSWNFGIFKLGEAKITSSSKELDWGMSMYLLEMSWFSRVKANRVRESELTSWLHWKEFERDKVKGRVGRLNLHTLLPLFQFSVFIRIYLKSGGEIHCPNICRVTRTEWNNPT